MNYPSWSISAEMISYLLFGLVVLLAWGKRKNAIMAASIIIGMAFLIWVNPHKDEMNFRFIRGIVSFNIGYFVFYFSSRKFKVPDAAEGLLVVLFVALLYFAQLLDTTAMHAVMEHTIIPVFFGCTIFALIHSNGLVSRALERGVFQYLGKISYSVYLNHAIVLLVIPLAIFKVMKLPETIGLEFIVAPITVLAVVFYSHITYNLIELRMGRTVKNWMIKPSASKSYPANRSYPKTVVNVKDNVNR
jgi:peptidoglycan/LPS O-acetylase OafA/YrhL